VAKNTITVTYKVNEDGSLEKISKKAAKAAAATDKVTKAQDRYNKGAKGVAGATSNSTKAFSKMNSGMGGSNGLVAAYATFAANVFALTAAFGALQRAAQLQQLEDSFGRLANASGRTSSLMAQNLVDITNGAVSLDQALRTAAMGFSAGFSTKELSDLTRVAKGASAALGRDLSDSLDRLVRGTAKLEPEILDELGIFVKIDDAVKKYADTLGKTATSLTATERRQAFLNETLFQGALKFGSIADQVKVNPYDQLAAQLKALSNSILQAFSTVLGPVINFLSNNMVALVGVMVVFGSTLAKSLLPTLTELAEKQNKVALSAKLMAEDSAKAGKKMAQKTKIDFVRDDSLPKTKKGDELALVTSFKKALKSGNTEAKTFTTALGKLEALKKQTATLAVKNGTVETAAHKIRLAELEALRVKILKVQATEAGRAAKGGASALAAGLSAGEDAVAGTLEKMGEHGTSIAGLKAQWGLASEGFSKYRTEQAAGMVEFAKNSGFWSGLGQKVLGAFRTMAVGARLFGAALLASSGPIGWVIAAVGLLVAGMVALYNVMSRPTKSGKEFNAIADSMKEKITQLNDTNGKLVAGFTEIYIAQARANAVGGVMAEGWAAQAVASAQVAANMQAYANNLSVAAGIATEFSSAIATLTEELSKQPKLTYLEALGQWMSDAASNGYAATIEWIASGFGTLAEKITSIGTAIKEGGAVLVAFLDSITGGNFSKIMGEVGDIAAAPFIALEEHVTNFIDTQTVASQLNDFTNTVSNSFKKIQDESPEIAKTMEAGLKEGSLEGYLDLINTEVTALGEAPAKAAELLTLRMNEFTASMVYNAQTMQTNSDAISKFKENVDAGAISLRKFVTDAKAKNEYTGLIANFTSVTNAVDALKISLAAQTGDKKTSFLDALNVKIENGEIDLEAYGTTAEAVAKDATAAFKPYLTALTALETSTLTITERINQQKAAVADLQKQFENTKAINDFNRKMDSYARTGKFEITVKQQLGEGTIEADRKAAIDFANKEYEAKLVLFDLESEMMKLKLDFLAIGMKAGSDELKNINAQKTALEQMVALKGQVASTERDGKILGANAEAMGARSSAQSTLIGQTQTGTTAERMAALAKGGGFASLDVKDAEGNAIKDDATTKGIDESKLAGITAMQMKLEALKGVMGPTFDKLRELGPDGELVATIGEGALAMADAFQNMSKSIEEGGSRTQAGLEMAGAAIGAISGMLAASSKAKIAGIDSEIAAEQKRDGKSAESVARIKALEKKKENAARKAFEVQKKMQMASTVINTAAAIVGQLAANPIGPWNYALAAMMGAMGAAQLAIISGTSFQGGGSGGSAEMPSQLTVGSRSASVDLAKGQNAGGEQAYMRGEQGIGTGMTDFKPTGAFSGYKGRAPGGYIVGEQGPEVFMPEVPGEIIPAGKGSGGQTSINFSISAVDATGVEELLITQKGNIIRMIREAANEHGELFLEGVREKTY
jgi:hypothetical protein